MKLTDALGRLRAASAPLDPSPVRRAAQRVANEATRAAGGRYAFHMEPTPTGARIRGYTLRQDGSVSHALAARTVRRLIARESARVHQELAGDAKRRLKS